MLDMTPLVAPRKDKIIQNGLNVFERENLLQNGILHFVFTL